MRRWVYWKTPCYILAWRDDARSYFTLLVISTASPNLHSHSYMKVGNGFLSGSVVLIIWGKRYYGYQCTSHTYVVLPWQKYKLTQIFYFPGRHYFRLCHQWTLIERIYILCLIIIIKSEVYTITHCLGLGHETMVSAVCLSIFFWWLFNRLNNATLILSHDLIIKSI